MRLKDDRGLTRAALLMLCAIAVLLALLAVPAARRYHKRAETTACALAIASAQRKIDEASVGAYLTEDEAKRVATQNVISWEELCPSGGDCYLVSGKDNSFTIVCAKHTEDDRLRTRLNAESALSQLQLELDAKRLLGVVPDEAAVTLNGETLTVRRADEEIELARGTSASSEYKGTVAFFVADAGGASYFAYADERHCAIWRDGDGWTEDGGT